MNYYELTRPLHTVYYTAIELWRPWHGLPRHPYSIRLSSAVICLKGRRRVSSRSASRLQINDSVPLRQVIRAVFGFSRARLARWSRVICRIRVQQRFPSQTADRATSPRPRRKPSKSASLVPAREPGPIEPRILVFVRPRRMPASRENIPWAVRLSTADRAG